MKPLERKMSVKSTNRINKSQANDGCEMINQYKI